MAKVEAHEFTSAVEVDAPLLPKEEDSLQSGGKRILKAAGNLPLRLTCFVGCIGTVVVLILGFLTSISNIFQIVQDCYTILFTLSLAVVEMCWWS